MLIAMLPASFKRLTRRSFLRDTSLAAAWLAWMQRARAADAPKPGDAPPAKRLGVVLAGLGRYATGQLRPALQQTQFCKLVGVVTRRPDVGAQWAKDCGFSAKNVYNYDTMAKMADNADIDVVYVVTPNGLHAGHVAAAAKAGKHVICEKPMANSVAECDAMIAACRDAKRTLSIGYRIHFDPYHQELMRLAQGDFAPFTKMAGEFCFVMGAHEWRIEKKLSGGGPLVDIGIYSFHEACLAANANPIAVTAKEIPKKRPDFFTEVEEGIEWTMEFPGGATAQCRASYNENANHCRAEGAKGWIDLSPAFSYSGLKGSTSRGSLSFPPINQQAKHMDAIAQAILEKKDSPVPGELGRRDMVIMAGIYESAKTGKRVELKFI